MGDVEETYEEEFEDDFDELSGDEEQENEDNSDTELENEEEESFAINREMESYLESKKNMLIGEKITRPVLTKFEYTRIIGERTAQLQQGAEPMIDLRNHNISDCREIAELELDKKRIPLIIRRYLPNNSHEDWRLSELIIPPR